MRGGDVREDGGGDSREKRHGLGQAFALIGFLLIGSALVLPWLTIKLLDFAPGKGVITSWFWADTRQQMPGLSLALIALLLAVSF